jgi:hypothetical protein
MLFEVFMFLKVYPHARQWKMCSLRREELSWRRIRHDVILRVLKVQMACSHDETPIFYTGPHIGNYGDCKVRFFSFDRNI